MYRCVCSNNLALLRVQTLLSHQLLYVLRCVVKSRTGSKLAALARSILCGYNVEDRWLQRGEENLVRVRTHTGPTTYSSHTTKHGAPTYDSALSTIHSLYFT
jgi:hypothetical protein